jgi:hypothetical protein
LVTGFDSAGMPPARAVAVAMEKLATVDISARTRWREKANFSTALALGFWWGCRLAETDLLLSLQA